MELTAQFLDLGY